VDIKICQRDSWEEKEEGINHIFKGEMAIKGSTFGTLIHGKSAFYFSRVIASHYLSQCSLKLMSYSCINYLSYL